MTTIDSYWMWFDDSKDSVRDKVQGGIAVFQRKFGSLPTVCKLNSAHVNLRIDGIVLETAPNIPINNFWFGMEE